MQFPERFSNLPDYAFPRLRKLLDGHAPGAAPLRMDIGEPRQPFPAFVAETIAAHAADWGRYPPNDGTPELRAAIAIWLGRRFGAQVDPDHQVLALNGTREGLFAAAIALCPERKAGAQAAVLMPNPFYQVYAAAARAAGAEPVFLPATADTGFLPDLDTIPNALLERTALFYLCSPANPQGAIADEAYLTRLLELAERFDFRLVSDECYSEIWRDAPPPGALGVVARTGSDPERALAFHSLSKRSGVPGLRAGFVAGGAGAIAAMKKLRAYGGAPLPLPIQHAATRLWTDEAHVEAARADWQAKYRQADAALGAFPGYRPPEAGFFLWLEVGDGAAFALRLWQRHGVRVLPGAYLATDAGTGNPGDSYVRVAIVANGAELDTGLAALADVLAGHET
ncbi:MAG: aminotransferase class I/II-fold pyridoxal phosphate-dependent enzyme [Rhodobacteraceae bacterium]|nr:aminotransferase class I/II-fold pyridoxal phosphate-dependent enzyme [Paracoccaceae bacterium]